MPKSTAVKFELDVGKKTAAGRQINTRSKKKLVVEEIDVELMVGLLMIVKMVIMKLLMLRLILIWSWTLRMSTL